MANYDYSHIKELDPNDLSMVDGLILEFAKWVRTKGYGLDVREGIARLGERIGVILNKYSAEVNLTKNQMEALSNELNQTISGLTQDSEVKNARMSLDGIIFTTLKERLDNLEENAGTVGNVVGSVYLEGSSLFIEGLDSPNSPIAIDFEQIVEDDEIPFGIETIDAKDIGF
jgi:hypothetical protein